MGSSWFWSEPIVVMTCGDRGWRVMRRFSKGAAINELLYENMEEMITVLNAIYRKLSKAYGLIAENEP